MVDTGYKYPAYVENHNDRTPHWTNPEYIVDNEASGADEGETNTSSYPHATVTVAKGAYTDGLRSGGYGFSIPLNARINGVTAKTVRSGGYIRDNLVQLVVYNPATGGTTGLANKGKYRYRTDGYFLVDTYGSTSDLWGATEITPEQINSDSMGLYVYLQNISSSRTLSEYFHVLALNVNYTEPVHELSSTLPTVALQDSIISYEITLTCTNSIDQGAEVTSSISWPSGLTFISATDENGSFVMGGGGATWTTVLDDEYTATLSITAQCTGINDHSQVITSDFAPSLYTSINIQTSDPGSIYYSTALIDDTITISNLVNGELYTISAYSKVHDTGYSGIYAGIKNNRIAVVNGDEITGSRVTAQDTYQRVSVSFVYDNTEPLTLKLYGQYESVSTVPDDYWAGFTLKVGTDSTYSEAGNLLADPDALLSSVTPSVLTLPAGEDSPEYGFTFNPPYFGDATPIIQGLLVGLACEDVVGLEVEVTLNSGSTSTTQSVAIDTETTHILLGGETDLWDLLQEDIIDQELTLTITFRNSTLSEITPSLSNLTITWYWLEDTTEGATGFTYKGLHSSTYSVNLVDNDHDVGAEVDLEELNIKGRDGVLITGYDIKSKTIKEEFIIHADTLEEGYDQLRTIKTWLSNTRQGRVPVPEELVFDYEPDLTYLAIVNGVVAVALEYPDIRCEVTFLIPDGVAHLEKTTGSVGVNNGETHPHPVITLVCDGSSSIVVTESIANQELTINHTITSGTVIIINCEDRTIKDTSDNDYTEYVALDSVWPRIYSEYDFSTTTGGLIQNITYNEGY